MLPTIKSEDILFTNKIRDFSAEVNKGDIVLAKGFTD